MTENVLWASNPLPQARSMTEWRVVVIENARGRFTRYEFRHYGAAGWQCQQCYPLYDINKGSTFGLPAVTRELYDRHLSAISYHLSCEPTAAGLFEVPE